MAKQVDRGRRKFLKTSGVALSLGLAGCTGEKDDITTRTTTVQETTKQTTTSNDPLDQTHSADNLDGVVQELEQDSIPLNFVPADENAEYGNSIIFDEYSNNSSNALTVEIDLDQAFQHRHYKMFNWGEDTEPIEEFIENIDDPVWRRQILDQAEETWDTEYKDIVDWNVYTDESLNFEQRMEDSGMTTFWYLFEKERYGGVSSTQNHFKAHALQGTEQKAGFNTYIWDFRIPSHGLVSAIEHPTRSEKETENQETYIVETDPTQASEKDVARMKNSQYRDDPPFNGSNKQNKKEGLYEFIATETREEDLIPKINPSLEVQNEFVDYLHKPQSEPAYDHLDPITTAAYITEKKKSTAI